MTIDAILRNVVYDYGLWEAVAFNVALFGLFSLAFLRPRRRIEWRSMGVWSAFLVALFTEMYGFPLTIYLLTSVLGDRYPALFPFEHTNGHLWVTLLDLPSRALRPIHIVSNTLMLGGLALMGIGWWQVHRARGALVTTWLYRLVRHPQYTALFAIMLGALIQWPTLPTIVMAPTLLVAYLRLARREEAEMLAIFGPLYEAYRERTPAFFPLARRRPRTREAPDPARPTPGPAEPPPRLSFGTFVDVNARLHGAPSLDRSPRDGEGPLAVCDPLPGGTAASEEIRRPGGYPARQAGLCREKREG